MKKVQRKKVVKPPRDVFAAFVAAQGWSDARTPVSTEGARFRTVMNKAVVESKRRDEESAKQRKRDARLAALHQSMEQRRMQRQLYQEKRRRQERWKEACMLKYDRNIDVWRFQPGLSGNCDRCSKAVYKRHTHKFVWGMWTNFGAVEAQRASKPFVVVLCRACFSELFPHARDVSLRNVSM